jgi:Flp pilus assembly pilin Flp
MRKLVRRLWSSETGSALTEYGLIITVVALGLTATVGAFRNSVGDFANRTSVTISNQSGQGYGTSGEVGPAPRGITPVEAEPTAPDSSGGDRGDSTGVAAGSRTAALEED